MVSIRSKTTLVLDSLPEYCPPFLWAGLVLGRVISDELLECYRDLGANPVPLSTASLVTLVRKVERMENAATLDLRTLSYTLLHRFRADGLERDPDAVFSEFVVPVRQSGRQALKWDILAEQLLPGNSLLFPEESLTHHEKCALHIMLSSSVDPSECFSKGTNNSSVPITTGCRERGVVNDTRGAVSAGTVVAALCAASQPQTVSLRDLLASAAEAGLAPVLSAGTSAVAPRDREKLESLKAYSDMGSAAAVDSLWASTLAGDLSEVAIYQGPRVAAVRVGAAGFWDDPLLPINYVIGHKVIIDLTDAELRGGIDGLVLGGGLRAWLEQMGRLRLSQLLEMYYSPRGVVLDAQGQLRACQRSGVLSTAGYGLRLRNETLNMARLLYMRSDGPQLSDAAIQNYTNASVSAFSSYYRDVLAKDPSCAGELWNPPYVHLLVIMDSTWTPKEAIRLLTFLAQQADVSELGSSLSLLDGRGGRWVINGSRRFTDVPQALHNDSLLSLDKIGQSITKCAPIADIARNYVNFDITRKWFKWL
ncbi:uncharacterized protein LOC124776109 [Schistocerca piceifrons]|uniref:uncharacterized protein LOC124776109 n=1 Tax=Schistocerca piceifrons TaxID=274613 RepID=UPI001F5F41B0|nr:uncharacterized protein LOC124776109 [Schistocerca piceifrons]